MRAAETPDKSSRKETIKKLGKSEVCLLKTHFTQRSKVTHGYVCMYYHRMMYRKSVAQRRKSKYAKVSPDIILQNVFNAEFSYIRNEKH